MDIVTPALAIGSMLFGHHSQSATNRQNLRIAREQMAFQERMSGSEIQRRMRDAELAGVNPVFALGASGASSGSGASATMENPADAAIRAGQAAMAMRQAAAQLQLTQQQTRGAAALADTQAIESNIRASTMREEMHSRRAGFERSLMESGQAVGAAEQLLAALKARAGKDVSEAESARIKALSDALKSGVPSEILKAVQRELGGVLPLLKHSIGGVFK